MAKSEEIIRERYKVMAPRIIKALNQRNLKLISVRLPKRRLSVRCP